MATLQVVVPDASVPRIQAAFSAQQTFPGSGLPINTYIQERMKDFLREVVADFEAEGAATQARTTAWNSLT